LQKKKEPDPEGSAEIRRKGILKVSAKMLVRLSKKYLQSKRGAVASVCRYAKVGVPKSILSENDPPDIAIIPGIILYLVGLNISEDAFGTSSVSTENHLCGSSSDHFCRYF
jgi:hypothetical protein